MARKKLSRLVLIAIAAFLVCAALAFAFWPRATMVDLGQVSRGAMRLTVDEQGKTRVRDAYVISTPIDGRLLRVQVQPGDPVQQGVSVVAQMLPANPAALDIRTRGQALAAVEAAEAALHVAEANLEAARADADLAQSDLDRTSRLAGSGIASPAALERAQNAARAAQAQLATADAAIEQQSAQVRSARAVLIGFDDPDFYDVENDRTDQARIIHAPIDGVVLQVIHQDETTLSVGSPILVVGNVEQDLEVVVELISSDAINVQIDDQVEIVNWGGEGVLTGKVIRVEPYGETKVSALGVEEQRVTAVIQLSSPPQDRIGLGHGFAVEVQIVVWSADDILKVPSSALFREGSDWAVFLANDATAKLRRVKIGFDNGQEAEVKEGLAEGDLIVLYPPADLMEGSAVTQRVLE